MTRVLICGLCPLPFENTLRSFGPGIRTWQFAHSLVSAGHEVTLVAMKIPGSYEPGEGEPIEERDGVTIERLEDQQFFDLEVIQQRLEKFRPEVLVGATLYGSYMLAQCEPQVPFWADQFGHVMAEAQAKAHLEAANWPLAHFWNLLQPILYRADRLSVVSQPQGYAAMGELGLVGRLTHQTCGYEFTSVIPCALVPRDKGQVQPILRGEAIPHEAFIVLWSGGYNVWSDVDTLFQGLEKAMEQDETLHFVSTGGEIGGHDETTYRRFEDSIANSRFRSRYHLQGWVRAELIPSYQAEADLGVLTEIPIYEGRLGSKNRLIQWMGDHLPVLYNRVGELGELLTEKKLGLTFEVGDADAFAQQIQWAMQHRQELSQMADQAKEYTLRELSFEATCRELVAWVDTPDFAPDRELRQTIRNPADHAKAESEDKAETENKEADEHNIAPAGNADPATTEANGSGGAHSAIPAVAAVAGETASATPHGFTATDAQPPITHHSSTQRPSAGGLLHRLKRRIVG